MAKQHTLRVRDSEKTLRRIERKIEGRKSVMARRATIRMAQSLDRVGFIPGILKCAA